MSAANMILCLVLGALLPVFTQAITRQQAVGMEANDLIFDKDPFNLGIHCVLALVTSYRWDIGTHASRRRLVGCCLPNLLLVCVCVFQHSGGHLADCVRRVDVDGSQACWPFVLVIVSLWWSGQTTTSSHSIHCNR